MAKENRLTHYSSVLNGVNSLIKQDLEGLTIDNYKRKLFDLGYLDYPIESIDLNTDCKEIINNLPKNSTGVYVFKELSNNCLDENNWSKHKKKVNNKAPDYKKTNESENPVFYVGKSNNVAKRIQEHIEGVTKKGKTQGTNGLKLMEFIKANPSFKYEVSIFYRNESSEHNAINELVEPILHTSLTPKVGSARVR